MARQNPTQPRRTWPANSDRRGSTVANQIWDDDEIVIRTSVGDLLAIAGVITVSLATLAVIMMFI